MSEHSTQQLVVHGGAGAWSESDHDDARKGLRDALEAGRQRLCGSGSALDAVVEAVRVMEDNPLFNAGTGSCLNWEGEVEMDACVMVGRGRQAGAVAHVKAIRNPILLARDVMEHTDHVMLGGEGARGFARARGHNEYDPTTERSRDRLRSMKQSVHGGEAPEWPRLKELVETHPGWLKGTVGAVARDASGTLAAATSTGGRVGKLPGRIGDTPVLGAGTLATEHAAASATGNGELILRYRVTSRFVQQVRRNLPAPVAAQASIRGLEQDIRSQMGLVGVDRSGAVGIVHGSNNMPHGWINDDGLRVRMADSG